MKKILTLILFVLPFICYSQDKETFSDFSSNRSREKADSVLGKIEHVHGLKMLYSVNDSEYYIIIKDKEHYQEYFVVVPKTGKGKVRRLSAEKTNRMILSRIFRLKKYHTGFVTKMPDAKFLQGDLSYFVVKDDSGNRYGEFSLPFLVVPPPIDTNVYAYLTTRISELASRFK